LLQAEKEIMIHKTLSLNKDKVIVTFEIPGTVWADRINLVGDFNDWDRENLPFRHNREDNWSVEVELDRGREYRFRYLINGDYWGYDWHADNAPGDDGRCDSIIVADCPVTARAAAH
jgi:1,4-alpha-glucan branching enzyme